MNLAIQDNKQRLGPESAEMILPNEVAPLFNKQQIRLAGLTHVKDEYLCQRVHPQHHTILITIEGSGFIHRERQQLVVTEPSRLVILPAGKSFCYQSTHPWHFAWFILEDSVKWAQCQQPENVNTTVQPEIFHHTLALLNTLITKPVRETLARTLITELKGKLNPVNKTVDNKSEQDQLKLHNLFSYTEQHLHRPWDIKALASHIHISPQSLHRWCQHHYQRSPMQLVAQQRLERARDLLQQTDWPLQVIASHVGYADGFGLSKAYKRFFGVSPRRHGQM